MPNSTSQTTRKYDRYNDITILGITHREGTVPTYWPITAVNKAHLRKIFNPNHDSAYPDLCMSSQKFYKKIKNRKI